MSMTSLLAITPWPPVSAVILLVLAVAALYLARGTAHHAIHAVANAFARGLRLAARSVQNAERRLVDRNREVLLAAGREAKERIIEREFVRVGETVRKDLASYPEMHRRLSEAIMRIEEDQEKAVEVPPEPPGWAQAIAQVANVDSRDTSGVLTNIHKSMIKSQQEALEEYRRASGDRHALLRKMMPSWREIQGALEGMNKTVLSVINRGQSIDRHMEEFEQIVRGEDRAVAVLYSSSIVYFFISALVLVVATAGAAVNFTLIARPMAEMVGGTTYIGAYRTADIAALVIIMVEISMGLFFMESVRITQLFPVIGALSDRMRRRMTAVTLVILLLMASVEAGLAYMREMLMQDELATNAVLRGETAASAMTSLLGGHMWITTVAQMGLGFILPFALIFVAIPLETFVHSLRSVLGAIGIGVLRSLALVLRILSAGFRQFGFLAQRLYDLPLFVPLYIETRMHHAAARDFASEQDPGFELPESVPAERSIQRKSWRQEAQS
jgi:hypothetical protein